MDLHDRFIQKKDASARLRTRIGLNRFLNTALFVLKMLLLAVFVLAFSFGYLYLARKWSTATIVLIGIFLALPVMISLIAVAEEKLDLFEKHTVHVWDGCRCAVCGERRPAGYPLHDWNGCLCRVCGRTRPEGHDFDGCVCRICGETRHTFRLESEEIVGGRDCCAWSSSDPCTHCSDCQLDEGQLTLVRTMRCTRCGCVETEEHEYYRR